jgi:polyphosphate:AMP phosphotransferase
MFETAELGNTLDKQKYKKQAPVIREALLNAQRHMATADFSLLIIVDGFEGAGKGETVNLLLEWMDARGIQTHALEEPTDEERERPPLWRFWRRLPATGRTGIFFGAWYQDLIVPRAFKRIGQEDFAARLDRLEELERMLSRENTLIVKFWLHLSKSAQKARFKQLQAHRSTQWRVTKDDWKLHKKYDQIRHCAEQALRKTSIAEAPWHVVEGYDCRYRHITIATILQQALQQRIKTLTSKTEKSKTRLALPVPKPKNILSQLNLALSLSAKAYDKQLVEAQARLNLLSRRLAKAGSSLILVFEGPDAAGKGGTIRRITPAIDARRYRVITIAAPTDEERAHPYLWRFWWDLPRSGHITIYDRSWYGRVLVERLEGFADSEDWQRGYEEIVDFEEQLTEFHTILLKFYLVLSPDEQLRRFKTRQVTPYKQYKITEEDWRNRKKWQAYEAAACDMIERTSTDTAPWIPVEANDKHFARIKVLNTICERMEQQLG